MDFDKPKVYGDTSITDGLVLIQLLRIKDRQNVTHKQTDTVSEIAYFS